MKKKKKKKKNRRRRRRREQQTTNNDPQVESQSQMHLFTTGRHTQRPTTRQFRVSSVSCGWYIYSNEIAKGRPCFSLRLKEHQPRQPRHLHGRERPHRQAHVSIHDFWRRWMFIISSWKDGKKERKKERREQTGRIQQKAATERAFGFTKEECVDEP